jgi:DNA-binding transcriptional ArsR family regulator
MDHYPDRLDAVFQALADPTRRAVLARLGAGPASVTELAQPFDMALPSFMKHLRALEGGGLITTRKAGRVRTCALERGALRLVETWLAQQRVVWEGRAERLAQFVEDTNTRETPE